MNVALNGGCLCGRTRYRLDAVPDDLGDCHCVDCRRASGAAAVTWGTVPRERLRVTAGEVRTVAHAGRRRTFASCCGTPLFFEEDAASPAVDVTIATLDDPAPFAPRKVIWTEDRLPWVVTDPSLPHHRRSGVASGGG